VGDTGIVRRIDDLGRIVLPMELRRTLGIHVKDPISISVEGDRIILEKHHDACAICGGMGEMIAVNDRSVCLDCVALVKRT
jgi:transcriptional pleiotropic regulator of transition state genes